MHQKKFATLTIVQILIRSWSRRPGKIDGLYSTLALISVDLQNKAGENQLGLVPLILIDPKVMSAVHSLSESNNLTLKNSAERLIPGLQSLVQFGMHDYIHQMILPITDPQTIKLRLDGDDAPFWDFRLNERADAISQNHGFKPEKADLIGHASNQYELHAELANRDIWHQAFSDNSKIKTSAIRIATQFLSDLELLRKALENDGEKDFANKISCLMAGIGIARLLRIVDILDPELAHDMKLRNGETQSFIKACEALNIPPLEVCETRARTWHENLQLNDVIKPEVALHEHPALLQKFIDNPERFPKLSAVIDASIKNEKLTHQLTGFENVVARGFGGAGLILNVSALMHDFAEGKGPMYNTASLLDQNRRIMTTNEVGTERIPEEFYLALAAYYMPVIPSQAKTARK